MSTASFRNSTFDPLLLSAQIVSLQCTYYLSASSVIFAIELLTGSPITLSHVLSYKEIRTDTVLGWALFIAFLINAGIGCYAQLFIVQRAKLCLDFSCTLHLLHLLITSFYSGGIPKTLFWWFSFLCTLCIMAIGGEYLCMQKEMEPISLAGSIKRHDSTVDGVELQRLTEVNDDIP
ncbi:hypothetical protein PhCBS80983_g04970 [Powellomyces hirtus]|uniref:Protein SYS1 n=1 Tax=Powellomyces hirtus TaxID=109895 RepID=A0A507DXE1_9FUNG|nr:integral membrane protein S linking to the trans Golgi network-domain-containing protein [Powellomyces hirtus]TPX55847.1 hypothetical protein PhCBS80983_g04970 [Powellomyces hirtus]